MSAGRILTLSCSKSGASWLQLKTPTKADVTGGVVAALTQLVAHPQVGKTAIDGVVIGTTHFVNAVVTRSIATCPEPRR